MLSQVSSKISYISFKVAHLSTTIYRYLSSLSRRPVTHTPPRCAVDTRRHASTGDWSCLRPERSFPVQCMCRVSGSKRCKGTVEPASSTQMSFSARMTGGSRLLASTLHEKGNLLPPPLPPSSSSACSLSDTSSTILRTYGSRPRSCDSRDSLVSPGRLSSGLSPPLKMLLICVGKV